MRAVRQRGPPSTTPMDGRPPQRRGIRDWCRLRLYCLLASSSELGGSEGSVRRCEAEAWAGAAGPLARAPISMPIHMPVCLKRLMRACAGARFRIHRLK